MHCIFHFHAHILSHHQNFEFHSSPLLKIHQIIKIRLPNFENSINHLKYFFVIIQLLHLMPFSKLQRISSSFSSIKAQKRVDSLKEKSLLIRIIAQLSDQTQTKSIRCTPSKNSESSHTTFNHFYSLHFKQ